MKLTTLKGIFPDPKPVRRKNFIQENMKNLRQMEKCFQANKQMEDLQQLQLHKNQRHINKYQNVSAKVTSSFCERKKHESNSVESVTKNNIDQVLPEKVENGEETQDKVNILEIDKKHSAAFTKRIVRSGVNNAVGKQKRTNKHQEELQPKILSEPSILHKSNNTISNAQSVTYKSQGVQTVDTDQIDTIYSEGIILYSSKKFSKHNGNISQEEEKYLKKQSPTEKGDMHTPEEKKVDICNSISPVPRKEIDFIKLNKERTSVANKLATQLNNGIPPTNYRKGVIPKYLRDRKDACEKEQKGKEALYPDCPEGHVPLPDHERKETLRLLKKNYQDYVNELNMMPIKTDTLRAQRRKVEIEKQLNKLEEGIKVFSRPKVYVKINA